MARSTLTSKGQVTIPKEIRTRLGLRKGDRLEFEIDEAGEVRMRPAGRPSYRALLGLLEHRARKPAVSVAEMRAAVRERAAGKERGGE